MKPARFVVDNSVVVAWGLDESSEYSEGVVERLVSAEALVPGVWPLEFANALSVAERRGRITEAEGVRLRELVMALPISVIPDVVSRIVSEVTRLARQHELSVYDASYLDLALREGVPLATLDKRLLAAAQRCGVPIF